MAADRPDIQIVCCPGGPLLVRGAAEVVDDEGVTHRTTRPVVAVCRCGKSSRTPWCDGTHKLIGPRRQVPTDPAASA